MTTTKTTKKLTQADLKPIVKEIHEIYWLGQKAASDVVTVAKQYHEAHALPEEVQTDDQRRRVEEIYAELSSANHHLTALERRAHQIMGPVYAESMRSQVTGWVAVIQRMTTRHSLWAGEVIARMCNQVRSDRAAIVVAAMIEMRTHRFVVLQEDGLSRTLMTMRHWERKSHMTRKAVETMCHYADFKGWSDVELYDRLTARYCDPWLPMKKVLELSKESDEWYS